MMFENELRDKARSYIDALRRAGIEAQLDEKSIRNYSLKIAIRKENRLFGAVVLSYKAVSSLFSIHTNELRDKSITGDLERVWNELHQDSTNTKGYHVYVDGSFKEEKVGFGVVILKDGKVVKEISGLLEDDLLNEFRNVAGEIRATVEALQWCQENGITEVSICYDYQGIESWATGAWQARKKITRDYAKHMRSIGIKIDWQKIESHTGNYWNERADQLAGEAVEKATKADQSTHSLTEELRAFSEGFANLLRENGYRAEFIGIHNDNCAKLKLYSWKETLGHLNIYHTKKKPFTPRYHELTASCSEDIDALYRQFMDSKNQSKPENNDFVELDRYHRLFEPYRNDGDFDFTVFAKAILHARLKLAMESFDIEEVRYDFEALESMYFELKNRSDHEL